MGKERKRVDKLNRNGVAALGVLAAFILIGLLFSGNAEKNYCKRLTEEYEAACTADMARLQAQYRADMEQYEDDMAQYKNDSTAYQKEVQAVKEKTTEYDADFAEKKSTYEKKKLEYNFAARKRADTKRKLVEAAERDIFRRGLAFDVDVLGVTNWNNHVGHEWSETTQVNGEEICYSGSVTLKLGGTAKCFTMRVERDDTPDVGSSTTNHAMREADFRDGFSVSQTFSAYENRGRYAGYSANFTYTYTFTPHKYTVTIDESKLPEMPIKPVDPAYSPPQVTMTEPVKPERPKEPTAADIAVEKPNLKNVQMGIFQTYQYSRWADLLFLGTAGSMVWLIFKKREENSES